uniref:Uncharacterized protein n=1 Tax=Amphimedon queenslandica TaxID=400682 RepID=A0A1X7TZN8_AMPQE
MIMMAYFQVHCRTHSHNPPCPVRCYAAKEVKLMIPSITSCLSEWTLEYKGYLMSERGVHKRNGVFECVDENPESVDGGGPGVDGANGLPCPPHVNKYLLITTCVECTKLLFDVIEFVTHY